MTRVGIVGAGLIGTVHGAALRALIEHEVVDARVEGVFDVDRERAERLAGLISAPVAADVDGLLDGVDAVWICTWTDGHLDLVRAAADRGVAVFCEKPLAPTWADAVATADALAGVPHRTGLVLRTSPVFVHLADALAAGAHGAPLATIFRDDQYFPIRGFYASTWRADVAKAGGGTLLEHSIHDLDLLRWFLGDPESVQASIGYRFGYPGIDDTATVVLAYPDGSAATLVSVWHDIGDRASNRRVEVFCETALYTADDDRLGPLRVETEGGVAELAGELPAWSRAFGTTAGEIGVAHYAVPNAEFLADLAAGVTPRGPDGAEALAAHRLVEAAYRSAAAGGVPVPVATVAPGPPRAPGPGPQAAGGPGR